MKDTSFLKYIAALILFGSNGTIASYISMTSYEIVFTRTLIGSLFLILIFFLSRQKVQACSKKRHFLYLVTSGMAMGASFMCLFESYVQVGVCISTLAYSCGPVIVMMLSPILFKEKMTVVKLLGFFAVVLGMVCINGYSMSQGTLSMGIFYGISAAFLYAVMVVFNKKAASITGLENPMLQLLISFVTVAVFLGLKQGLVLHLDIEDLLPILLLGIVNTGVGCYFYFSSIGQLSVQTVAICGYLEPLSALVFSTMFLGEALNSLQWLGSALVFGGAAFGELYGKIGQESEEVYRV